MPFTRYLLLLVVIAAGSTVIGALLRTIYLAATAAPTCQ